MKLKEGPVRSESQRWLGATLDTERPACLAREFALYLESTERSRKSLRGHEVKCQTVLE